MNAASQVAGVDEAGRGPLAGPVVVAAVILHRDRPIAGLGDSKQLRESERDRLSPLIQRDALRCISSCDHNALVLKTKPAGAIWKGEINGYPFIAGQLYETSDLILPLIQVLHNQINDSGIVICDFCPGNSNSVSIGLQVNDIAVVIVKPEPEWKKNLNSMQEMVENRKARIAVIYNSSVDCDLDYENDVMGYCASQSILFLGIIPNLGIFNTAINDISSNKTKEVNDTFLKIWGKIVEFCPKAFA